MDTGQSHLQLHYQHILLIHPAHANFSACTHSLSSHRVIIYSSRTHPSTHAARRTKRPGLNAHSAVCLVFACANIHIPACSTRHSTAAVSSIRCVSIGDYLCARVCKTACIRFHTRHGIRCGSWWHVLEFQQHLVLLRHHRRVRLLAKSLLNVVHLSCWDVRKNETTRQINPSSPRSSY